MLGAVALVVMLLRIFWRAVKKLWLQAKQGEFGCFLQLAHNWASFDATRKSYELWQRHVTPVINKVNEGREIAYNWARDNKERFIGAAMTAAMQTIQKHHEEQARKSVFAAKAAE